MTASSSFPPLIGVAPRLLILGTMPGQRSLEAQQYYAHPRNSFWWIMEQAFGVEHQAPYAERMAALSQQPVVLWDVLASCVRPGSLDADICRNSEMPNEIGVLLARTPSIADVFCNGQAAAKLFERHVAAELAPSVSQRVRVHTLPSTSPAYAALSREKKTAQWLAQLAAALEQDAR